MVVSDMIQFIRRLLVGCFSSLGVGSPFTAQTVEDRRAVMSAS